MVGTYLDEDENAIGNIWRKVVRVQLAQTCHKAFDRLEPWQECLALAEPFVCLILGLAIQQPRVPLVGISLQDAINPVFYQLVQGWMLFLKVPHRLRPYWALVVER